MRFSITIGVLLAWMVAACAADGTQELQNTSLGKVEALPACAPFGVAARTDVPLAWQDEFRYKSTQLIPAKFLRCARANLQTQTYKDKAGVTVSVLWQDFGSVVPRLRIRQDGASSVYGFDLMPRADSLFAILSPDELAALTSPRDQFVRAVKNRNQTPVRRVSETHQNYTSYDPWRVFGPTMSHWRTQVRSSSPKEDFFIWQPLKDGSWDYSRPKLEFEIWEGLQNIFLFITVGSVQAVAVDCNYNPAGPGCDCALAGVQPVPVDVVWGNLQPLVSAEVVGQIQALVDENYDEILDIKGAAQTTAREATNRLTRPYRQMIPTLMMGLKPEEIATLLFTTSDNIEQMRSDLVSWFGATGPAGLVAKLWGTASYAKLQGWTEDERDLLRSIASDFAVTAMAKEMCVSEPVIINTMDKLRYRLGLEMSASDGAMVAQANVLLNPTASTCGPANLRRPPSPVRCFPVGMKNTASRQITWSDVGGGKIFMRTLAQHLPSELISCAVSAASSEPVTGSSIQVSQSFEAMRVQSFIEPGNPNADATIALQEVGSDLVTALAAAASKQASGLPLMDKFRFSSDPGPFSEILARPGWAWLTNHALALQVSDRVFSNGLHLRALGNDFLIGKGFALVSCTFNPLANGCAGMSDGVAAVPLFALGENWDWSNAPTRQSYYLARVQSSLSQTQDTNNRTKVFNELVKGREIGDITKTLGFDAKRHWHRIKYALGMESQEQFVATVLGIDFRSFGIFAAPVEVSVEVQLFGQSVNISARIVRVLQGLIEGKSLDSINEADKGAKQALDRFRSRVKNENGKNITVLELIIQAYMSLGAFVPPSVP